MLGDYGRNPNACASYLEAILWIAIKIIEHRSAGPEKIIIEEEECPVMRDVTPRKAIARSVAALLAHSTERYSARS